MSEKSYHDGFENWESVMKAFQVTPGIVPEPPLVFAFYDCSDAYSGSAMVIFKDEQGDWWQNYGGHCSCYGLEGQWDPEPFDPLAHLEAVKDGRSLLSSYNDLILGAAAEWLREVTKS